MIKAVLTLDGKDAEALGLAIEPDNLVDMFMNVGDDQLCFELSVSKIGTLLATLDDLLMNLKIAEDTLVCSEER